MNIFVCSCIFLLFLNECSSEYVDFRNMIDLSQLSNKMFSSTTKTNQKMKLTIAILLPQDYIRLRNFNVCINKEMNKINRGNWSFTKTFYLDRFNYSLKLKIYQKIKMFLIFSSNLKLYDNYS
jgi:hypothetical protein